MTVAEHAARARRLCVARGLAAEIHYAPRATARADALYRIADATGLKWWRGGDELVGLLADGRMALVTEVVSVFERADGAAATVCFPQAMVLLFAKEEA